MYFMKMTLRFLLVLMLLPLMVKAQNTSVPTSVETPKESDVRVSFLTCAPGHQSYRLYGHTAIRVDNPMDTKEDWVYNYGWFSFDTPNFVMKFVLGLTDYSMAQQSTALFLSAHIHDDMPVTQQVLNLTPEQAAKVKADLQSVLTENGYDRREFYAQGIDRVDTLVTNTPNWTYRYSFLRDNCTTRAVETIVKAIEATGETVVYPTLKSSTQTLTHRGMIHEFTHSSPWQEFGQDILLGAEVDRVYSIQEMTRANFLPTYAEDFFRVAKIKSKDGSMRPLVASTEPLFPFTPNPQQPALPFGPNLVFGTLLALAALLTFGEQRSRRQPQANRRAWRIWTGAFDLTLLIGMGLTGGFIAFMVVLSEHPGVSPNWLLTIFHPLWLIYAGLYIWMRKRDRRDYFALLMTACALAYFGVFALGIQQFPLATVALACILLIRGVAIFFRPQKA